MKFLSGLLRPDQVAAEREAEIYKSLLHWQGRVGGQLFGETAPGTRREFFQLDKTTWVWHEEWTDEKGRRQAMTTRYDVRPNGIVKSQGDNNYHALSSDELRNFRDAVRLYYQRVAPELERMASLGR